MLKNEKFKLLLFPPSVIFLKESFKEISHESDMELYELRVMHNFNQLI